MGKWKKDRKNQKLIAYIKIKILGKYLCLPFKAAKLVLED